MVSGDGGGANLKLASAVVVTGHCIYRGNENKGVGVGRVVRCRMS